MFSKYVILCFNYSCVISKIPNSYRYGEFFMTYTAIVMVTVIVYMAALIGIGFWAKSRNDNTEDFFLGGRKIGPIVGALSYSASAASAWTLLGLSGAAYLFGVSVIWVVLGSFLGMLIAYFWIGPRLLDFSHRQKLITFTDFITFGSTGPSRVAILILSSAIILFCFSTYVASQFQGAGSAFSLIFEWPMYSSVMIGGAVIMIYSFLGGFLAISITDTIQGFLMAVTALLLPVFGLIELGGPSNFVDALRQVSSPEQISLSAGNVGLMAVGMIVGSICIGVGTFGQPHLMVRFMAIRDQKSLFEAGYITIVWYFIVFGGMCLLGLIGHILFPVIDDPELIFFAVTERVFPPAFAGILLASVLSAIMSTADSQLLVCASTISHDLGLSRRFPSKELFISRVTIAVIIVIAIAITLSVPSSIFDRVVFSWVALGSAFGPLVFVRLFGIKCGSYSVLMSITTGFGLAVSFSLLPNTIGDILERGMPFLLALFVLLIFRKS